MKDLFLLDPSIHYLDHGAFGAVPKVVFEEFLSWQRRLEHHPVKFFLTELGDHMARARSALADLVGSDASDLAFVPNATHAVNLVARSLPLGPGDEVLTGNHEYGACDKAWSMLAAKQGFKYVRQHLPLGQSPEERAATLWEGVTPATKVIFMSHITSPTAMILPVAEVCAKAREYGILTVIDGAHAVGQIPLDMQALGADFYASNAHKWLLSPKSSAFLFVRPEHQSLVEPLVISWGWGGNSPMPYGSAFLDNLQWPGTANVAAYLTVPAAIAFQAEHDWPAVRERCHQMLTESLDRIAKGTGMSSPYLSQSDYAQMAAAPVPAVDPKTLHDLLLREHRVEIPVTQWEEDTFVRLSVQGYTRPDDLRALEQGLQATLSRL